MLEMNVLNNFFGPLVCSIEVSSGFGSKEPWTFWMHLSMTSLLVQYQAFRKMEVRLDMEDRCRNLRVSKALKGHADDDSPHKSIRISPASGILTQARFR